MESLNQVAVELQLTDKFQELLNKIEQMDWKKNLQQDYKLYSIKQYNIEKLSTKRAREMYHTLVKKFYLTEKSTQAWHENELRLYIWTLIAYSHSIKKPIYEFDSDEWLYLSGLFYGKSPELCEFQFLNIKKTPTKNQKWSQMEDQFLVEIINQKTQKNKWNEIAKEIFYRSGKTFFRNAKQCRQRWNNYLDPQKIKGGWQREEDIVLINCVLREGKKWAFIAKTLEYRRTEHMVKNRYKSLQTKFKKLFKASRFRSERDLLIAINQYLIERIDAQSEGMDVQLEHQISEEIRMPTEPAKGIQSCSQLTDITENDQMPRLLQTPQREFEIQTWEGMPQTFRLRSRSIDSDFLGLDSNHLSEDDSIF